MVEDFSAFGRPAKRMRQTNVEVERLICNCPKCLTDIPRGIAKVISRTAWFRHLVYFRKAYQEVVLNSSKIKSFYIETETDFQLHGLVNDPITLQSPLGESSNLPRVFSPMQPPAPLQQIERIMLEFGIERLEAEQSSDPEFHTTGIQSYYRTLESNGETINTDGLDDNVFENGMDVDPTINSPRPGEATNGQNMAGDGAKEILQGILEMEDLLDKTELSDLKESLLFIKALRETSLDDTTLEKDDLYRLRNPPTEPPDISDPDVRLSLDIFIALDQSSQDAYRKVRTAITRRFPACNILTFEQVRAKTKEISGVCMLSNDMCIKTCVAFTGPYADMTACPICDEPRYDQTSLMRSQARKKVPRRKYQTLPLGFQLQAGWRDPKGAFNMRYRERRTAEILDNEEDFAGVDDYIHGTDYLELVRTGKIKGDDIALMFSIDGAQLYQSKASDCWIYIWVILNYSPDLRYKKTYVIPGAFIPGPNKPKHLESFLLPGLQHLAALQKEGLNIWDSAQSKIIKSYPFLLMATADGPAMAQLSGFVGHHGKIGCRLYCGTVGRHKPGGSQYYPALSKPTDSNFEGSNHTSICVTDVQKPSSEKYERNLALVLTSTSERQYRINRLSTGISRPSIFLGLQDTKMLPIPHVFPLDVMHLVSLNLSDLILGLWRGQIDRDPQDNNIWYWATLKDRNWEAHGKMVADTKQYLPSSFDRPPRNPAEKINSGYKAFEFLNYVFGVGPGLFIYFIPQAYFQNYCKLVRATRLLQQRKISKLQIFEAHRLLLEFVLEFENLYYRQATARIHFIRQSVHLLLHLAHETSRTGPLITYSQWTMERTIGNLGQEIKQHSNPFANLSERGARRCRVNAITWMFPEIGFENIPELPRGSDDLGNGYVLLRARDSTKYEPQNEEISAIISFLEGIQGQIDGVNNLIDGICKFGCQIFRWARLQVPTGQIARSLWKEKTLKSYRSSRNVKFKIAHSEDGAHIGPNYAFGEVQYFFKIKLGDTSLALAMVSKYGNPNPALLKLSSGALYSSKYLGSSALEVIDVKSIISVVAMVKHPFGFDSVSLPETSPTYATGNQFTADNLKDSYYLVEKIGLDTLQMAGYQEIQHDEY